LLHTTGLIPPGGAVPASEQDTGQEDPGQQSNGLDDAGREDTADQDGGRRPLGAPPHALWLRALQHSSILLTYRPPPRGDPIGGVSTPAAKPPSGSKPSPPAVPRPGREPPNTSTGTVRNQKPESGIADAATRTPGSLLDICLLAVGAFLVVCSRVTLTRTWAWSWHGPTTTFTLSRMHGACTSTMGELAQGASGDVASHCLWVDTTWTAVVALGAAGCILAAFGIARMLRAIIKPP
jgi:hypothetical protein